MKILAIESSGSAAGAAVLYDEKVVSEVFLNHKLQHSVILMPIIEEVLRTSEITMDDIDAVAVSGGPGSFTGLRIGVSTAKGLAQGGNKKFVAVSSLDAMAFQQYGFNGIICPMMDALRDNVYTCIYSYQGGELFKICDYSAEHIDELLNKLEKRNENIVFCGDAVGLHKKIIVEKLSQRACFAPVSMMLPRASSIAELAAMKILRGQEDDIYTYSPVYLRKSQAEREYERKHGVKIG
jgi:tRNA threonylcarbamoyl adenosine modification protein YeaZ